MLYTLRRNVKSRFQNCGADDAQRQIYHLDFCYYQYLHMIWWTLYIAVDI